MTQKAAGKKRLIPVYVRPITVVGGNPLYWAAAATMQGVGSCVCYTEEAAFKTVQAMVFEKLREGREFNPASKILEHERLYWVEVEEPPASPAARRPAYLRYSNNKVARTEEVGSRLVFVDYDADGAVVGIELL